jgi:hypothetical protein
MRILLIVFLTLLLAAPGASLVPLSLSPIFFLFAHRLFRAQKDHSSVGLAGSLIMKASKDAQ